MLGLEAMGLSWQFSMLTGHTVSTALLFSTRMMAHIGVALVNKSVR